MGKLKQIALAIDDHREKATEDIRAADRIIHTVNDAPPLQPGDHEAASLRFALLTAAEALGQRATSHLSTARYLCDLIERTTDTTPDEIQHLRELIDRIDPDGTA